MPLGREGEQTAAWCLAASGVKPHHLLKSLKALNQLLETTICLCSKWLAVRLVESPHHHPQPHVCAEMHVSLCTYLDLKEKGLARCT